MQSVNICVNKIDRWESFVLELYHCLLNTQDLFRRPVSLSRSKYIGVFECGDISACMYVTNM